MLLQLSETVEGKKANHFCLRRQRWQAASYQRFISPHQLEKKITHKSSAIMNVHCKGNQCYYYTIHPFNTNFHKLRCSDFALLVVSRSIPTWRRNRTKSQLLASASLRQSQRILPGGTAVHSTIKPHWATHTVEHVLRGPLRCRSETAAALIQCRRCGSVPASHQQHFKRAIRCQS